MRIVLFRGRRVDTGDWVYGYYEKVQLCEGEKHYIRFFCDWGLNGCLEVVPKTVGQFIGLTDKNGKEIYEGDIVTCVAYQREQIVLGEYQNEKVTVAYFDGYFHPFGYNAGWRGGVEDIEVIGNIYQNPELCP